MNEDLINHNIWFYKNNGDFDTNLISDGYHTFGELYEHRITLFISLCKVLQETCSYRNGSEDIGEVWRLPVKNGWFLMGMNLTSQGGQISYHLPESKWNETDFANFLHEENYEFDGHTGADVLERLKKL
jgi:hypothetical protein